MTKQFNEKDKELIKKLQNPLKNLEECTETLKLLKKESSCNNPYQLLGRVFELYKQGSCEPHADWYFYKYLEGLKDPKKYIFRIDEEDIEVIIDTLNPFVEVDGDKLIDPRWHLFISLYAYVDAMYNHRDNDFAKKIIEMPGCPSGRTTFNCKSLKKYIEEASIET